jgi:hypothetical protein
MTEAEEVVTTTETSAAAAAALAGVLGVTEEEAWDLINRAAEGDTDARSTLAGAMSGQRPSASQRPLPSTPSTTTQSDGTTGSRVLPGSDKDQCVVLVEGFLSDEDIAAIDTTPTMAESIEAGNDGRFPGLVGGDRYTDADGLSIFGSAKHRSWRIEKALDKASSKLFGRLSEQMAAVDSKHWQSLQSYLPLQRMCEVEYISYDASVEGSRPSLAPHVDNGAKVTIVALLRDQDSFTGGVNFFGGGLRGGARSHRMRSGA